MPAPTTDCLSALRISDSSTLTNANATIAPSNPLSEAAAPTVPLRVAHVLATFGIGGAERIAALLANGMDRERFHPMIVSLGHDRASDTWDLADDVEVVELRKPSGNSPRIIFRLAQVLRERAIDIVHTNNWGTLVETTLARRLAGVPCHVHVEHGVELADLRLSWIKRKVRGMAMRWAFRRVDALVSVCDGVTQRLTQRCGIPAQRVLRVANGVEAPAGALDATERERVRTELGIAPATCVVGSVGRLAPVKDFGTAIEAVAQLARGGSDVQLLLVGDGPDRDALARQAEACGLGSRVRFAGKQGRVGPWLAAMDVYVNSSLSEGMSLSILEAMSAGLPLVVTDVGANSQLVGGDSAAGLVVPAGDTTAMAKAIVRLIASPDERQSLGKNSAARFQQNYSADTMVSAYADLYNSILDGGKRATPTRHLRTQ